VLGHDLRAVAPSALDEFAEVLFGCLQLPGQISIASGQTGQIIARGSGGATPRRESTCPSWRLRRRSMIGALLSLTACIRRRRERGAGARGTSDSVDRFSGAVEPGLDGLVGVMRAGSAVVNWCCQRDGLGILFSGTALATLPGGRADDCWCRRRIELAISAVGGNGVARSRAPEVMPVVSNGVLVLRCP
jgi:hypothetical protein